MPKVFSEKQKASQAKFREKVMSGMFAGNGKHRAKKGGDSGSAAAASEPAATAAPKKGVPVRLIVYVVLGTVAFVGLYIGGRWVYRRYFLNRAEQAVATAQQDVYRFRNQGLPQTYPDAQYNTIADTAYEGMRYSSVADDYEEVVTAMQKLQNNLDVALAIVAYGTRQEYNFGIPDGQPKNLFQQIADDLNADRRRRINDDWTAKQISYRV